MTAHDNFISFLDALPSYQLDKLIAGLLNSKPQELACDFPALTGYSIECVSKVNSYVYKITPLERPDPFVLKLFEKMEDSSESIKNRLMENPILNKVISPIFWKKDCLFDDQQYTIQIQPYWLGGDLQKECEDIQGRPGDEIIGSALNRFLQIAKFYRELEKENILFADGKLANFIRKCALNGSCEIGVIDLKNFEEATENNLRNNAVLNDDTYPLRIPATIYPRKLSHVHARHLGIAFYGYLLGLGFGKLVNTPTRACQFTFNDPLFTTTENGKALALLLQMLLWDDQEESLEIEEIIEALDALQLLTQLEAMQKRDPCNYIKETIRDLRDNFEDTFQYRELFQKKLLGLQYVDLNQSKIKRIGSLVEQLEQYNSIPNPHKESLNEFLVLAKKELIVQTHDRAPLDELVSKLEKRLAQPEATKFEIRTSNNRYSSFNSLGSEAPPLAKRALPKKIEQKEAGQKKKKTSPCMNAF